MRLRYLAFAWIAIAIPTACSLTSLDGFSGGAPDAALDTTTTDGGPGADAVFVPPSDARSDARSDGAGPGVVCPQKPVALCEPFATDEKTNGWEISQGGGATVGIQRVDGGQGLVSLAPSATAEPGPTAFWHKSYPTIVSKLSLDTDIAYDKRPLNDGEFHIVLQVRIEHGATWNLIYLSVHPDKTGFVLQDFTQAGAGAIDFQVVDIPPGLTAHHLHFDVAVGGRTHFAIDGVQLQDYVTDGFMQAGTPSIYAGVSLSTIPATPIAVGFANLVFTGE